MKKKSGQYLETSSSKFNLWSDIDRNIDDILSFENEYNPWKIDPIGFEEFCTSPQHMNFPRLSDKQKSSLYALLGSDPKKTFEDPIFDISVIVAGKGSGKDTISALFICYLVYLLCCMTNPQRYFFSNEFGEYPDGESIDLVNVARSAAQASRVFFEKFKNLIRSWPWLSQQYDLRMSGKSLSQAEKEGDIDNRVVNILSDTIVFPGKIRAFSLHSDQETSEGLNILSYVLDEFAAFKNNTNIANAEKVFNVFNSSAKTRFPKRYKGLIISYPRYKDDPIMTKVREIEDGSLQRACYFIGATWEFNPTKKRSDFDEDYRKDPEGAKCRYECIPPSQEDAFISLPEKVDECVSTRKAIIEFVNDYTTDAFGKQYVAKTFVSANISRQNDRVTYKATMDLGKDLDSAVLNVGHIENNIIIQDLLVEWVPKSAERIPVDFDNVYQIILFLKANYINITETYCDHWNSASHLQNLSRKGIQWIQYRLTIDDWIGFKTCMYARQISLLPIEKQTEQIKKLKLFNGIRVDHPYGGHDDIAVTCAGLYRVFKGLQTMDSSKKKKSPGDWISEDELGYFIGGEEDVNDFVPGIGMNLRH